MASRSNDQRKKEKGLVKFSKLGVLAKQQVVKMTWHFNSLLDALLPDFSLASLDDVNTRLKNGSG